MLSHTSLVFGAFFMFSFIARSPIHAQTAEPEPVNNIITADGVKIQGTFYENSKPKAPTVIMLHPIGEDKSSKSPEWESLAKSLVKAGYSVLMFDFRGHGESTTIADRTLFWNKKVNSAYVKSKDKGTIDVKDYIKAGGSYLPVLVNDIAAARTWLDRRNDENKDCNTKSIMIVAADQGATLAAVWMNAEWHRYKYTPGFKILSSVLHPLNIEEQLGKDIIGAVFLTPQPTLEKRSVSISKMLKAACYDNGTATAIFHGKDDTKGSSFAKNLAAALKPKKESKEHVYIDNVELNTKLTGVKLLQKGLGTEKAVVEYLDSVKAARAVARTERKVSTTMYVWRLAPNSALIPANFDPTSLTFKGVRIENNLNFDDYNKFVQ